MCALFLLPIARQTQNGLEQRVAHGIVQTDLDVILDGQLVEQTDVLEGTGDAHAVDLDGGLARAVHAVDDDRAARGLIDAGQQVEDRGLACTVRADQTCDLRPADGQIKVVHGAQTAEVDAKMDALEDRVRADVALRNDGIARNGDHFALHEAMLFAHFDSSSPADAVCLGFLMPLTSLPRKPLMVGLFVVSMTRISTIA